MSESSYSKENRQWWESRRQEDTWLDHRDFQPVIVMLINGHSITISPNFARELGNPVCYVNFQIAKCRHLMTRHTYTQNVAVLCTPNKTNRLATSL